MHPLPPSSGPRPLSWCRHTGWCHLAAPTQHREPQGDREATAAASWVSLLVPLHCKGLSRMEPSAVLPGLLTTPWHLPTFPVTWSETRTLGKKEPETLFSNRCLDSQGVFQHGSQRPLQVYWEWEVQILSRILARKLPLSVFQPANGREEPWDSRVFLIHTLVVNESLWRFKHYAVTSEKKKKSPVLRSTVNIKKIILKYSNYITKNSPLYLILNL